MSADSLGSKLFVNNHACFLTHGHSFDGHNCVRTNKSCSRARVTWVLKKNIYIMSQSF